MVVLVALNDCSLSAIFLFGFFLIEKLRKNENEKKKDDEKVFFFVSVGEWLQRYL